MTIFISKLSEGNTTDNNNQSVSITIIDNEPLPMVSISINTESVYDYDPDVTITATSTIASQEDISVIVSTSGTATEGIDYGDISDITIVAGSTTGTSIFDPTKDTVNEGEEFAVISISSVLGADLSTSEATSVSIIIKEDALKTATLFTEGTALEQDAITRKRAWLNVNSRRNKNPDQDPNQPLNEYYVHPYEQMNVHKAQSFSNGGTKLRGKDKLIHIIDRGCDTRHAMFDNKIVHNLEEDGAFDNDGEVHCNAVSSLAAANGDGDTGIGGLITGVAPEAGLVLSRLASRREMAEDIDRAKELGAVVSSNSWGFTLPDGNGGMSDFNFKEFQDSRIAGKTNSESLVGLGDTAADVDKYIASLKNFQKTGVIVFAAGNGKDESDVNLAAAMPELFPELKGAWIVAGLVKFKGDSIDSAVESEFTLEGNKCGSSKEYCVVVDGMDIAAAGGVKDGNSGYIKASGSSFSAPMVSGGIALLSQAFPNHTPKQITARLLATANNKWFAAEGYTEFGKYGKGVRHGYHSTWGHGLPDFYAALRPVTSDTHPETMLYTGSSIQSSGDSGIALSSSSITPSSSFGDSIIQGLMGEVSYAYDALNSGFKYNMEERVDMSNNNAPTIDLTSELSKLGLNLNPAKLSWKDNFNKVLSKLSEMKKLRTSLTVGSSSLPVQSFFGSNFDSSINLNDYKTPYLESGEGGIGISAVYKLKNSRLLIGMTNPVDQNIDNTIGVRKTLVTSLEYGDPSNSAITIMSGITEDKDSLLGATGNNAYSFSGSRSDTSFIAFKTQIQLSKDLSLTSITTLANSDMTKPDSSFINSANNVKSTSVSVIANKRNIFGGGNMSFFVSQPNRVNSGDMSIKLSNLADSDGNLTYRNKNINLEPTARQLNYGLSYNKHLNENTSFLIKHMITNNLNHKKSSKKVNSSFIGVKYKHLKIGLVTNPSKNDKSAEALYNFKF